MKLRTVTNLERFSDGSIDLFVESSIGKPMHDSEGEVLGHIVEANRIDGSKQIEVIIEADDSKVPHNVINMFGDTKSSFSIGGSKRESH